MPSTRSKRRIAESNAAGNVEESLDKIKKTEDVKQDYMNRMEPAKKGPGRPKKAPNPHQSLEQNISDTVPKIVEQNVHLETVETVKKSLEQPPSKIIKSTESVNKSLGSLGSSSTIIQSTTVTKNDAKPFDSREFLTIQSPKKGKEVSSEKQIKNIVKDNILSVDEKKEAVAKELKMTKGEVEDWFRRRRSNEKVIKNENSTIKKGPPSESSMMSRITGPPGPGKKNAEDKLKNKVSTKIADRSSKDSQSSPEVIDIFDDNSEKVSKKVVVRMSPNNWKYESNIPPQSLDTKMGSIPEVVDILEDSSDNSLHETSDSADVSLAETSVPKTIKKSVNLKNETSAEIKRKVKSVDMKKTEKTVDMKKKEQPHINYPQPKKAKIEPPPLKQQCDAGASVLEESLKRIEDLEIDLKNKNGELYNLKNELVTVQNVVEERDKVLTTIQGGISKMVDEHKKSLSEKDKKIMELTKKNTSFADAVKNSIKSVEKSIKEKEEMMTGHASEKNELEIKLKESKSDVEKEREMVNKYKTDLEDLEREIDKLSDEKDEKSKKFHATEEELQKKIKDLGKTLEKEIVEKTKEVSKSREFLSKIDNLESKNEELKSKITKLKKDLEKESKEKAEEIKVSKRRKVRKDYLEKKNEEIMLKLTKLDNDLVRQVEENSKEKDNSEKALLKIEFLETTMEELRSTLTKSEKDKESEANAKVKEKELSKKLKSRVEYLEKTNADLNVEKENLSEVHNSTLTDLKSKMSMLEDGVVRDSEIQTARTKEFEEKIGNLQTELKTKMEEANLARYRERENQIQMEKFAECQRQMEEWKKEALEMKRYQRNLTSKVSDLEMEKFSKTAEIQTQVIIIKGLGQKVIGLESDTAMLTDQLQSLSAEKEELTDNLRQLTEEKKILLQTIENQPLVSSDDPVTEGDLELVKSVPICTSYVVSTSPRALAARKKRVQPDIDFVANDSVAVGDEDEKSPPSDDKEIFMEESASSSPDLSCKSLPYDSNTDVIEVEGMQDAHDLAKQEETQKSVTEVQDLQVVHDKVKQDEIQKDVMEVQDMHDVYDTDKQGETQKNSLVPNIIEDIIEKGTGGEDESTSRFISCDSNTNVMNVQSSFHVNDQAQQDENQQDETKKCVIKVQDLQVVHDIAKQYENEKDKMEMQDMQDVNDTFKQDEMQKDEIEVQDMQDVYDTAKQDETQKKSFVLDIIEEIIDEIIEKGTDGEDKDTNSFISCDSNTDVTNVQNSLHVNDKSQQDKNYRDETQKGVTDVQRTDEDVQRDENPNNFYVPIFSEIIAKVLNK